MKKKFAIIISISMVAVVVITAAILILKSDTSKRPDKWKAPPPPPPPVKIYSYEFILTKVPQGTGHSGGFYDRNWISINRIKHDGKELNLSQKSFTECSVKDLTSPQCIRFKTFPQRQNEARREDDKTKTCASAAPILNWLLDSPDERFKAEDGKSIFTIESLTKIKKFEITYRYRHHAPGWKIKEDGVTKIHEKQNRGRSKRENVTYTYDIANKKSTTFKIPYQTGLDKGRFSWVCNAKDGGYVLQDVPGCGKICSTPYMVGRQDTDSWGYWSEYPDKLDINCPAAKIDELWQKTDYVSRLGTPQRFLIVGDQSSDNKDYYKKRKGNTCKDHASKCKDFNECVANDHGKHSCAIEGKKKSWTCTGLVQKHENAGWIGDTCQYYDQWVKRKPGDPSIKTDKK